MDLEAYHALQNQKALAEWERQNPPLPEAAMPNVNEMLYSKYLSKADLAVPLIMHIRGVSLDSGGGGGGRGNDDPRWVMHFNEHRKALRLNNTILRYLEATLGGNSDAWVGAKCRVFVDPMVQMAGQVVGGVRLEVSPASIQRIRGASQAFQAPQAPQAAYAPAPARAPQAAPAPAPARYQGDPVSDDWGPAQGGRGVDPSTGEVDEFNDPIPF